MIQCKLHSTTHEVSLPRKEKAREKKKKEKAGGVKEKKIKTESNQVARSIILQGEKGNR